MRAPAASARRQHARPVGAVAARHLGRPADRARARRRGRRRRPWCARCCRRRSTGGSRAWPRRRSSSTSIRPATSTRCRRRCRRCSTSGPGGPGGTPRRRLAAAPRPPDRRRSACCSTPSRAWCCDSDARRSAHAARSGRPSRRRGRDDAAPPTRASRVAAARRRRRRQPARAGEPLPTGLGGFAQRRPRATCWRSTASQRDAGAVVERDGQSALRHARDERGRRAHVGGEQPREPAHAVCQRPGAAIRPPRPSSCATTSPATSGRPRPGRCRGSLDGAPWTCDMRPASPRFTRRAAGLRPRARDLRRRRAPVKVSVLTLPISRDAPRARSSVVAVLRVGARSAARRPSPPRRDRLRRRRAARSSRATRSTTPSPARVAFLAASRTRRARPPAIARPSSAGTARSPTPAALRDEAWRRASAAASIRARPCRSRWRSAPGEIRGSSCCRARPGRRRGRRARAGRRASRRSTAPRPRAPRARRLGRHARHRAGAHARRLVRHDDEHLAGLPDALLPHPRPHRLLPARRRLRLPRSAPGRAGALPCAARADARAPAAGGRPPVRRGRRAALVARALGPRPALALLGRPAVAALRGGHYVRHTGDDARARRARAVPDGARRWRPRPRSRTTCRRTGPRTARCSTTACAPSTGQHRRRARPAALRRRRLERRHEPRRRRRAAARARGSASSCTSCCSEFAWLVRAPRPTPRAPRATAARPRGWRPASKRPGTASGIAAATTTTARRSARRRTTSAASTRSRSRGRCCRARCRAASPSAPSTRCARSWSRAACATASLLTPPFDRSAQEPGYIKGYPPGMRENGGQYTHAAAWFVMALADARLRRRGDGALPHDQPDQPRAHAPPTWSATRSSRTWWPATSTRTRPIRAAAAGRGTPGRPAGSTGPASSGCSACAARGATFAIDPCVPSAWPGFEIRLALRRHHLRHPRRQPAAARPRRRQRRRSTAWPSIRSAVPLPTTAGTHVVRWCSGITP